MHPVRAYRSQRWRCDGLDCQKESATSGFTLTCDDRRFRCTEGCDYDLCAACFIPNKEWICPSCTFQNMAFLKLCAMCGYGRTHNLSVTTIAVDGVASAGNIWQNGDKLGCGVDYSLGLVWFTRNGTGIPAILTCSLIRQHFELSC